VYTGVGLLVALVLYDIGRQWLAPPGPAEEIPLTSQPPATFAPTFKTGDKAPDFTLPDHNERLHALSSLVRRDTLLTFACGCANCIDLQTFTALMFKRLGSKAPDAITVTTMPKDREETYLRDTGLKQQLLYERKEGPIMKQYQGHPCPRVYRLAPDRTITWIGSSPGESRAMQQVGLELATQLGFSKEEALALKPASASAPAPTP
jgi:hypothetical protein